MNKKYEYCRKIYCKDDLSEEIDNYGGDLYDLFLTLESDGKAGRAKIYYRKETDEPYEDYKETIGKVFDVYGDDWFIEGCTWIKCRENEKRKKELERLGYKDVKKIQN